jgi:hypothetical protein
VYYCIDLSSLSCQQIILTDYRGNRESFERFSPQPNELYLADRAYGASPASFRRELPRQAMEFGSLSHKGQGERECLHVFDATKHARR